ncbi:MAG: DUF1351 domain-containing protein [Candidatus Alectryocaccobium sp.]|jgi:hypothetical protein
MAFELKILNPKEDGFIKEILWNNQELMYEVQKKVAEYKDLVYTDEQIPEAKKDRATLNKLVQALDAKRKEIKKMCLIPADKFAEQVNEIIAVINEPIAMIDKQLSEYEEIEVRIIEDEDEREKAATIGYYAMFEYLNGFRKTMYWTRSKMERHALNYSQGYKAKKGYTFWEKDFDAMAYKTMLRQLISKWGIMSIEMQTAMDGDMGVIEEDGTINYVDNDNEVVADAVADVKVSEAPPEQTSEQAAADNQKLFG